MVVLAKLPVPTMLLITVTDSATHYYTGNHHDGSPDWSLDKSKAKLMPREESTFDYMDSAAFYSSVADNFAMEAVIRVTSLKQ